MQRGVTRADRIVDGVSLVLVLAGATCYVWAYLGMQALRDAAHDPTAPIFAGYMKFQRLSQISYAGLSAIALGVIVGIGAAVRARRRGRE
jgi:hypothetical protein